MNNPKDFYQVLGVTKNATEAEIKRAYKKLAMKYHPDRNSGKDQKEAEKQFKEIQEAYDVLSDNEKRSFYDRVGHNGYENSRNGYSSGFDGFDGDFASFFQGASGGFNDIFQNIFGGGHSNTGHTSKGEDIQIKLQVKLEDILEPLNKEISYKIHSKCSACNGLGAKSYKDIRKCSTCHGQGNVMVSGGMFLRTSTCRSCNGQGKTILNKCKTCNGTSIVYKNTTVTINIPAGIEDNQVIRKTGSGNAGLHGGSYGDLYVIISIIPNGLFERRGMNLFCDVTIPFTKAILGGTVEVPVLGGKVGNLTIPAGTQQLTMLRVKSKGLPNPRNPSQKGDLFCRIILEIPVNLKSVDLKKINNLESELNNNYSTSTIYPKFDSYIKSINK